MKHTNKKFKKQPSKKRSYGKSKSSDGIVVRAQKKKYGKVQITRGITRAPENKMEDASFIFDFPSTGYQAEVASFGPYPRQGTTMSTRIGSEIFVESMEFDVSLITTCFAIPLT